VQGTGSSAIPYAAHLYATPALPESVRQILVVLRQSLRYKELELVADAALAHGLDAPVVRPDRRHRCRTHYLRNLLTRLPKSAQPHVATQVRTIFDQADADAVHAQYDRVIDALEPKYREAAEHLDAARAELLAFTAYPRPSPRPSGLSSVLLP
jgi:transposase-like protein